MGGGGGDLDTGPLARLRIRPRFNFIIVRVTPFVAGNHAPRDGGESPLKAPRKRQRTNHAPTYHTHARNDLNVVLRRDIPTEELPVPNSTPYVYICLGVFHAKQEVGKSPLEARQNSNETNYAPGILFHANQVVMLAVWSSSELTNASIPLRPLCRLSSAATAAPHRIQR